MNNKLNRSFRGFTLIELLVVVAIIAALAIIIFAALKPGKRITESHASVNKVNMDSIRKAANLALVDNPSGFSAALCSAGPLPTVPTPMRSPSAGAGYDIAPCLAKYFKKMPVNIDTGFYADNANYDTGFSIALNTVTNLVDITIPAVVTVPNSFAFLTQFGTSGTGNGQFGVPAGIAVDSGGNIYVVDQGNHRVEVFNSSYAFQYKIPATPGPGPQGSGNADGQFNTPTNIALASNGDIYVTDTYNHRVQQFTSAGTFVRKFGTGPGNGASQFTYPFGIDIDNSTVYVVDSSNYRVRTTTLDGTPISPFGSVTEFGSYPRGIDIANGQIYVTDVDQTTLGVNIFSIAQSYLSEFGQYGSGGYAAANGRFAVPLNIEHDIGGNMYVVDQDNNRIQAFTSAGVFKYKFNDVNGASSFAPNDVHIAPDGKMYVSDVANARVVVFMPQ